MTAALLGTLPLQILCQLVLSGNSSSNDTDFAVNQSAVPQVQPTVLPNSTSDVQLATLPLRHVCQLLVTSNPLITKNGTLVVGVSMTEPQLETFAEEYESSDTATAEAATFPGGYVTFRDVRTAYRVHENIGTTWNEARERCAAEGAVLAIPDSLRKIKHINSLRSKQRENKWLHIGIRKSNVTNRWVRIDNNRPAAPILWYKGFPDDIGNCTGIAIGEDNIINYGCDWKGYYYACEKPMTRPTKRGMH